MREQALRFVAKCSHCGKAKNMHRAFTLDCPTGKRTRTGYTTFGPHQFTPEEETPAEADAVADETPSGPR
jgi:hypothetical protein